MPLKKDQLLIGLLTGILLIVIAWPVEEKGEESVREKEQKTIAMGVQKEEEKEDGTTQSQDAYTREMEERLSQVLSQVEGVGDVQVLITWKTSSEKVVEKDVPTSSQNVEEEDANGGKRTTVQESQEETTVYEEAEDGSRRPYVVKEIKPVAEGVLVIAEGGGSPIIAQNILEAVQALFPLDSHKIKIMKMEGSK